METCWIYFAATDNFLAEKCTKRDIFNRYLNMGYDASEALEYAEDAMKIKIGETKNRGQRRNMLLRDEGRWMYHTIKFKGTKADRLFVEGYVRSRIEHRYSTFNISHIGNDHFYCLNSNVIRTIQREFPMYVEEGLKILENIKEKC